MDVNAHETDEQRDARLREEARIRDEAEARTETRRLEAKRADRTRDGV